MDEKTEEVLSIRSPASKSGPSGTTSKPQSATKDGESEEDEDQGNSD